MSKLKPSAKLSDEACAVWLRSWASKNIDAVTAVWDLMFDIADRVESRASADAMREALLDEVIEWLESGIGAGHTEAFVLGCKHSIEVVRHFRQEHLNRATLDGK